MSHVPSPGFARNPSKVITIEPFAGTVTITSNGVTIACTSRAKVLSESPYPPAFYIPFVDIDFTQLEKTDHTSHGYASYWSVVTADNGRNAMWAHEDPFHETAAIKSHGSFYPDKVMIRST